MKVEPGIVVIGAGLAGLACTRALVEAGLQVTLVDKARGPGGRTSTRRDKHWTFDHGAARLELGAPELAARRAAWEDAGVVAPWVPRVRGERTHPATWIGVPGSNALASHLARGLDLRVEQRVDRIEVDTDHTWRVVLASGDTLGPCSTVISTAPAPQALTLLDPTARAIHEAALASVVFAPCVVAMVVVRPHDVCDANEIDELHVADGPLAQAHRMDRRPGRSTTAGAQTWVLHAREAWSTERLEDELHRTTTQLFAAFARELPCDLVELSGHRWRYARATRRIAAPYLLDRGLGFAGDWFEAGTRAPAASRALLSGFALAEALQALPASPR